MTDIPAPFFTKPQLVKMVFKASAVIQVATAKYMPRIRKYTRDRPRASKADRMPPTMMAAP